LNSQIISILRCYKFPRLIRVVSIMAAIYTHMFPVILKVEKPFGDV
jgi:hypothetical protein